MKFLVFSMVACVVLLVKVALNEEGAIREKLEYISRVIVGDGVLAYTGGHYKWQRDNEIVMIRH